jgi:hypothetical protein
VYYVKQVNSGLWSNRTLGAIESRGARRLPHDIEREFLFPSSESIARILAIEAMSSRTQQWIVTLNALGRDGFVHHKTVDLDLRGATMSLPKLLETHGERFQDELTEFHSEARNL